MCIFFVDITWQKKHLKKETKNITWQQKQKNITWQQKQKISPGKRKNEEISPGKKQTKKYHLAKKISPGKNTRPHPPSPHVGCAVQPSDGEINTNYLAGLKFIQLNTLILIQASTYKTYKPQPP